jgi:uncharacterized repeat protein (TIGR01451 family)
MRNLSFSAPGKGILINLSSLTTIPATSSYAHRQHFSGVEMKKMLPLWATFNRWRDPRTWANTSPLSICERLALPPVTDFPRWLLLLLLFSLFSAVMVHPALGKPDKDWEWSVSRSDCSGASDQGSTECSSYTTDLYEDIDYDIHGADSADIHTIRAGADDEYVYIEFEFKGHWSDHHSKENQIVLEFDVDPDVESNRADYYVGLYQKKDFNKKDWVDAEKKGGYEMYRDANDDVGGAQPLYSDRGGFEGDGYETNIPEDKEQVYGRVDHHKFQVAVKRSALGNPSRMLVRAWSRQTAGLDKDKLYFHDHSDPDAAEQIDTMAGLGTGNWLPIGGNYTTVSGTKSATPSTTESGGTITYSLTVSNAGPYDASIDRIVDTLPEGFAYVPGSTSGLTSAEPEVDGQALTWSDLGVATGTSQTLQFQATAGTVGGTFYNRFTIQGGNFPEFISDDTAPVTVTAPLMKIAKSTDKTTATPGETLTYAVRYHNDGDGPARQLHVLSTVPLFTTYLPDSLRIGDAESTYDTARSLTDAPGDDEGEVQGQTILFRIDAVPPSDGNTGSGSDEGFVYYRVTIN